MAEFQLVLPCYNEAQSLEALVDRAAQAALSEGFNENTFQLLLVQNGSKDNSCEVLAQLKAGTLGKWFEVVDVPVNQGYGFGLWSGLSATTAEFVGWSHADQQCDPRDAFVAYKMLRSSPRSHHTLVKGVRAGRNWKDILVSRVFETLAWLILRLKVFEMNAQPKVFHRSLLSAVRYPPKTFAFDLYVLYCAAQRGFAVKTLPVLFPPRIYGASNWAANFFSRYKTILAMIGYMCDLSRSEGRIA